MKAGLDVFPVQGLIPFKIINGLKSTKYKIEEALKIICKSHNLALAQVWIGYEDKNQAPLSSSFEHPSKKALKLAGYLHALKAYGFWNFETYYGLCDTTIHQRAEHKLALKTLQDHKSRYVSRLQNDNLVNWDDHTLKGSGLVICLRSNETDDFDYVFEFMWIKHSDSIDAILLEALLLTLKRCLPSFKFASGAELGGELNVVIHAENSADSDPSNFKSPQATGRKSVEVKRKTALKVLHQEAIEKQFGRTMKEDAQNLKVGESTLKRKCENSEILEWAVPKSVKRRADVLSVIQIDATEEDNEAMQEPSVVNPNENTLTIEAEYANDMIKFGLPISQATFQTVQEKISMKFNLSIGGYTLRFPDEAEDLVSSSFEDKTRMLIEGSKESERILVRLQVLPQTVSGILERPEPKSVKSKADVSTMIQIEGNEEDNGAIQVPSIINTNDNTLTIKAEYAHDMIKFHLPISQATFETVREKIRMKFNLSAGSYTLKYPDEDEGLVSSSFENKMRMLIKSSKESERILVRLQVLPQSVSGILERPEPKSVKRKVNVSSVIQIEEDDGAIQVPSVVNADQCTLTIKAQYADDMIKFQLPFSQATFEAVQEKISKKLNLGAESYTLKYHDEDLVSLSFADKMRSLIESSEEPERILIRLQVLPSTQSVSAPSGQSSLADSVENQSNNEATWDEEVEVLDTYNFMGLDVESTRRSSYKTPQTSFYTNPLLIEIPSIFHPYITHIQDVASDGNCGFRAVLASLGHSEECWPNLRSELLNELNKKSDLYSAVFSGSVKEVQQSLSFQGSGPAPHNHWMLMPYTGILISNRFGVIVHCLAHEDSSTCFPLWTGPQELEQFSVVTIAHVHKRHFVMVRLEGEYPMPQITALWNRHKNRSAAGWESMYMSRLQTYLQYTRRNSNVDYVNLD